MSSLAGHANQAHASHIQDLTAEQMNLLCEIHQRDHTDFDANCAFCTFKAVWAVEDQNRLQGRALAFLTKIGESKVLDELRQVRNVLGNEGPRWLYKEMYLR